MVTANLSQTSQNNHGFLKLVVAIIFFLLTVLILIEATPGWAKKSDNEASPREAPASNGPGETLNPANSENPVADTVANPASINLRSLMMPSRRLGELTEWSPISPVPASASITFDEVLGGTNVESRYQNIKFSSDPGLHVFAYYSTCCDSPVSPPNTIIAATYYGAGGFSAQSKMVMDFAIPVDNLKFYICDFDAYFTVAKMDVYQDNVWTHTFDVPGSGSGGPALLENFQQAGINHVTRIIIRNITDPAGLTYDNFSFSYQSPSPSPTPTPTPPVQAPQLLSATASDEGVALQWTGTLGANCVSSDPNHHCAYRVKRLTETGFPVNGGTTTVSFPQTSYTVGNLTPNEKVYFAVSAVNENLQESANSNTLSATPLHNCGVPTNPFPRPTPATWDGGGWHFQSELSDRDGLVIRNVTLNGRSMAEMMSLPYFEVRTDRLGAPAPGVLTPDNANATAPLRTRLVGYDARPILAAGHIIAINLKAQYVVDNISPQSKSCLFINQEYQFNETVPGDGCELSGTLACSRFYPKTSYRFAARDNERLLSLTLPQRFHFKAIDNEGQGASGNTVGVFKDCDVTRPPEQTCYNASRQSDTVFAYKDNPVHWEAGLPILVGGQLAAQGWDNYHQSAKPDRIVEPGEFIPAVTQGLLAGCPDCVHIHWRWGTDISIFAQGLGRGNFGAGRFLGLRPGSNQDLYAGVVRYHPGEEHPTSFESLKPPNGIEPLRAFQMPNNTSYDFHQPYDVVFWYIPTGHLDYDEFFNHGGFFNPNLGAGVPKPVNSPSRDRLDARANSVSTGDIAQPLPPETQTADGPTSVTFGYLYKDGEVTFGQIDPSTVAPLPSGYVALNGAAYTVTTDAVFSGLDVVTFSAASVNDPGTFANLRILHAEPDPFDPGGAIWIDRTILSPDPLAPDFAARKLSARVAELGAFVIAIRTEPPSNNSADLSISMAHSPEPVSADTTLVYTIVANNFGPQSATGAGFVMPLPEDLAFASVSTNRGSCKFSDGTVYCKLNTMAPGDSAMVTLSVKPIERNTSFSSSGTTIKTEATIGANENDPNSANNTATDNVTVLRATNARPSVAITSPDTGTWVVGPTSIPLITQASDSDGSISRVDFYDGETLLGSGVPTSTANEYRFDVNNAGFGTHVFRAAAVDNGGKSQSSNPVTVIVNGPASVGILRPINGSVVSPGSDLQLIATASTPNGIISKVEFLTDGSTIGEGAFDGSIYQLTWASVPRGSYVLAAVATDSNGIKTISQPITVTVTNRPTVSITQPVEGTSLPSGSNISIEAQAQGSAISKVEFYGDGTLLGIGAPIGNDKFVRSWPNPSDGFHSVTAVATDDLGLRTSSLAINIGVNTPSNAPGEFIWFDDNLPAGAVAHGEDASNNWYWVDSNPAALSGSKAHQSRIVSQFADPPASTHKYYFDGATMTLPVNAGDRLFTYVFLDINNMPSKITLEWKDANGWEHRAYWTGRNDTSYYQILYFGKQKPSYYFMGPLPEAGKWVRLEVPANKVGLEGSTLSGMAFTLDGGRATFDLAGKVTQNAPARPTTPPGDTVWFDDALPAGATMGGVNEQWNWNAIAVYSGQVAHQSSGGERYVSHSFTGAQTPLQVYPGDVLFTYVYLGDPDTNRSANVPDEIMLQWYDGTSWEHRAYWGENFIGQQVSNIGVQGTESQRYMGGLPKDGRAGGCGITGHPGWCRLEVPAGYVGLEGKAVSGMAFTAYRNTAHPVVFWDRSGKAPQLTTTPLQLSSTSGVWELYSSSYGYSYNTNDQGEPEHTPVQRDAFFAHTSQAAATVPMYRFRRPGSYEYFYHRCRTCLGTDWQYDGIAFYVYPDASTPNTVPLYLYRDNHSKYVLTIDQNEAAGKPESQIWAYVYGTNPQIPFAPTAAVVYGCYLQWRDNSATESGFKIELLGTDNGTWSQIGTTGANVNSFCVAGAACNQPGLCMSTGSYRVRAFNNFGDSAYSNVAPGQGWTSSAQRDQSTETSSPDTPPPNAAPNVEITGPANGGIVDRDFAIYTNASDLEGNGTLTLVEVFANGNKIGEVTDAPFVFLWKNAPVGTYSLTTIATDNMGATTTSAPVNVTVGSPVTFNITGFTGVYDGQRHGATGTAIGANGENLSSLLNFGNSFIDAPGGIAHWSFAGNSSYVPASGDVAITITPRTANISVSGFNGTYDGQPHGAAGSATGVNGENLSSLLNLGSSFTNPPGGTTQWTFAGNDNYNAASGDVWIVISKATPVLNWNNPSDMAAGTALTATQLNATASVPGTFSYSPAAGTVLSLGNNQQLSVTFTPTDSNLYNSVTATVRINVVAAILFSDDFNDNLLDASKWAVLDPNSAAVVSEQGQELRITLAPNTAAYNGVYTKSTYDLRGRTVQVDMVQHASQAGWAEDYFEAVLDGQNWLYMSTGAGSMVFASVSNGVTDRVVINYDPNARYLRMRHDQSNNTINLETSADRINWTVRKSVIAGFSLTAVRFHLVAGAWGAGNSSPGAARFDNIQLIPNETADVVGFGNRGFELPVLGGGGYQYTPANAGWTFIGGGGVSANGSAFTYGNPAAPEGNQVAVLQGGAGSSISQPVSGFRSDVAYTITFAAAQRGNCCGYGGQDFQIYLDDLLLATIRPSSTTYVDYSSPEFNTTAGVHVLKFAGLNSSGGDNTAFIDNVRITNTTPPTIANAAAYVSQSIPATMVAGRKYSVSVAMRNTGSNSWTTPANYNLGSQGPQDNLTWGLARVGLSSPVPPGAKTSFNFVVTAPATAGTYTFQWRMVQDGVAWFGDTSPAVTVNVVAAGGNTPYLASQTLTIPGILETELYDNGGEGSAYHDTTPGTYGQDYDQSNYPTTPFRLPTDVDIYKSAGGYSNSYLVLMQAGDWMNYTVNVAQTGMYMISSKTYDASATGGTFHFECDGVDVTGALQVPGDASNWREVKKSSVWLTAGPHVLKLAADTNGSDGWYTADFDYVRFELVAPQPVRWTSTAGVSVSGNSLSKSAADGWGNAGAISSQSIGSGDGYVEVTVSETNTYRMIGLSNGDTSKSYEDIDFALYPSVNGTLSIYEGGTSRGNFGSYATGDVLRVGVEAGAVVYRKNGQTIFRSNVAPSYPLLVDTALYNGGSTLTNAIISCSAGAPGPIEAELFDNGGEGLGYHDTTPGSHGADYDQPPNYPTPAYRLPIDVDVYKSLGYSNGYLTLMQAGDWMNYTINVPAAGNYALQARVIWGGANGTPGTFHVEVDGVNKSGTVQLPDTNWGWSVITPAQLQLTAGQHVLRLVAETNAPNGFLGDIDYLNLVPITSGLVGYWKFDENSGTMATDSSGQGNTGTLVSGASWALGHPGTAVVFDGASGYVQVGARQSLTFNNSATVAAWIYPTGNTLGMIVNKEAEYEVARFPDGSIQWAFANTNPGWAFINTGGVAPANQWTHVVVTYDAGIVKTYINGTLTHTYNGAGPIGDVDGNQNDFRIGGRQCCSQFFSGRIDEAKVYNRALAPAEVTSLFNEVNAPSGGYSFKKTITIDHNKVPSSDQSNFPVVISGTYAYLATTANGGNVQNPNGYDVIFTSDSGCATKLNHEVETYNALTGAVNYWVKVPTLSHTTDTVIYMCYGNSAITASQENSAAVWDANFKAVYHLKDGTTLNMADSTANHALTNNGATASPGQVDGAALFDGSTQFLSAAQHADFDWANLRTVEVWMKLGNTSQTLPRIFSQGDGAASAWSLTWIDPASVSSAGWAGNFLVVSIGTQATPAIQRQTPDNGSINSTSLWHHVVVIGDGTTVAAIYIDGVPVTISNYGGAITNTTVSGLNISRRNNNARYFTGGLDEIRFSNVQRSSDWIRAEYNNQSSPSTFYSISSPP